MKRKIIISFAILGLATFFAIGGSIAYFSDAETSTGNTFKAGKLNLKIDNTCNYNGKECVYNENAQKYFWEGTEEQCYCSWNEKDLSENDIFFNFPDIKPGDTGEDTISLHVDNNDAWICAEFANLAKNDNGCDSPENKLDSTCGDGQGELQDYLLFSVWKDNGAGANACNDIKDIDESYLIENQPASNGILPIADSMHGPAIPGDAKLCYGIKWTLPLETGNIIQTDSLSGDMIFTAVQARNMNDFVCTDLGGNGGQPECANDSQCAFNNYGMCSLPDTCQGQRQEGYCDGGTCKTRFVNDDSPCGSQTLALECGAYSDIYCNGEAEQTAPVCPTSCESKEDCDADATCNEQNVCVTEEDYDGDGYLPSQGDCDNTDATIHPEAYEYCDGVDNDCDGTIDEDYLGLGASCDGSDADSCNEGNFVCALNGLSMICNDNSSDSSEICYDTIDNDCDGEIDENCSTCIPSGAEICGNDIDEDCNGSDLECPVGSCAGMNCDDSNMCTTDSCMDGNCIHTNADGSACFNMSCTMMTGTCQAGSCVCSITPVCSDAASCEDGDLCTIDSCFLGLRCDHTPKDCEDGNSGTYNTCNPETGQCTAFTMPNYGFCINLPWGGQWCNGQ